MQQAIELAKRGLYTARPNPCVGCVIVDSIVDKVVAIGWHDYYGGDHAEVMALKNLYNSDNSNFYKDPKNAKRLDVYVTLEPCSHFGKTPPCVDALLNAKVGSVFIAILDPNPLVSSKSVAKLRDAGITVKVGMLEGLAKELNSSFLCAMEQKRCYVRVKTAISLDGKVALKNGQSKWITGKQARLNSQKLRARSGAIITGIGTLLADNPKLNVRLDKWPDDFLLGMNSSKIQQPIRVLIDPKLDIDLDAGWLKEPGEKWLVYNSDFKDEAKLSKLSKLSNIYQVRLEPILNINDRKKSLEDLLDKLFKNNCNEVMLEAGPGLTGSFLEFGLVDELWCYQNSCIIGDKGLSFAKMDEICDMKDILRSKLVKSEVLGDDLLRVFYF